MTKKIMKVELPVTGQVYAFRTAPYSEFAPPSTGRYAALKIYGVDETYVTVAVLNRIWTAWPTLSEASSASLLMQNRFYHTGRAAICKVSKEWWSENDLEALALIDTEEVSSAERSSAEHINSYSTLRFANYAAEGEWRWANDRDALTLEHKLVETKANAGRAAAEARYRDRLSKLTWETLLLETSFERWSPSPPFPPQEFTEAAREVIRKACEELRELGPKPRRPHVRAILKATVEWFNEADERAGHVIETEEREDICAILEEMAHVARQKALVDEIDMWRDW